MEDTLVQAVGSVWNFLYTKVSGETYAAIVATVVGFWFRTLTHQ